MINILPYKQKTTIKRLRYIRITIVILGGSIVLMVIAVILFLPTLQTINSRYAIATQQVQQLEQSGEIVKAVDVANLEDRTETVKEKLAAVLPAAPMKYVDQIRAYAHSGIQLTGYEVANADKPVIEVHGVAATRESLQQFIAALQSDPTVSRVDSPVANFVKSTESEFDITVAFKTL